MIRSDNKTRLQYWTEGKSQKTLKLFQVLISNEIGGNGNISQAACRADLSGAVVFSFLAAFSRFQDSLGTIQCRCFNCHDSQLTYQNLLLNNLSYSIKKTEVIGCHRVKNRSLHQQIPPRRCNIQPQPTRCLPACNSCVCGSVDWPQKKIMGKSCCISSIDTYMCMCIYIYYVYIWICIHMRIYTCI